MTQDILWYWLGLTLILLLGLWDVIGNLRANRLSGFPFYVTAAFLQGVPFFVAAILFAFLPGTGIGLFFLGYIPNRLAKFWTSSQVDKMQQKDPSKWQVWEAKRKNLSKWDKLFLPVR